jgi:hypothetical protein
MYIVTAFERDMTIRSLEEALTQVNDLLYRVGAANKHVNKTSPDLVNAQGMLASLCHVLNHKPFHDITIQCLPLTWDTLQAFKHHDALTHTQSIVLRQHIMLTTGYAWHWLDVKCRDALQNYTKESGAPGADWIRSLIFQVVMFLSVRIRTSSPDISLNQLLAPINYTSETGTSGLPTFHRHAE